MDTCQLRLRKDGYITAEGINVSGIFIHHPLFGTDFAKKQWATSHAQSGQSLLAVFKTQRDAKAFAEEMASHYNLQCSAEELLEQFKTRGDKPSCADIAEKYGMMW